MPPPRAQHLINVLTERNIPFEVEEDGDLYTIIFEDHVGDSAPDRYSATWLGRKFLYGTSGWDEGGDSDEMQDEMSYNTILSYAREADPEHEHEEVVES